LTAPLAERAPAKLNLCLYVGGVRDDGLHEICSIFVPLDLGDDVRLEPGTVADEVICPGVHGRNLAETAMGAFRKRFEWDGPPVRVTIEKRIPVGGGLGGGSADAAATLRLMCRSSGLQPEPAELAELAMDLGADVPSQLEPRLQLVTGAGERLEELEWRPVHGVLLTGPRGLSSRRVYGRADSLEHEDSRVSAMAERLRGAWATAESPLDLGELLHNDLQPAATSLELRIGDAIDLLRGAGAAVALASGSGPSVFGLFAGPDEATAARDRIAADWDGEAIAVQAAA